MTALSYAIVRSDSSSGGRWHLKWLTDDPDRYPRTGLVRKFQTRRAAELARRVIEGGEATEADFDALVAEERAHLRRVLSWADEAKILDLAKRNVATDLSSWGVRKKAQ